MAFEFGVLLAAIAIVAWRRNRGSRADEGDEDNGFDTKDRR